jgi:hypothetical protein
MELIISTIAICLSTFVLLVQLDIIRIKKEPEPKKDKFKDFRDPVTGLLRGKPNE